MKDQRLMDALPGVYPLRFATVLAHLLVDDEGCVLIDTGLIGVQRKLAKLFRKLGREPQDLKAVLLTHGHLDHTGNLHVIKRWSNARIWAHAGEQIHIDGKYPYKGIARVCGILEAVGRSALFYTPEMIDFTFVDGDVLPFWGGLRVVHLPGHTHGHCGFYSERHGVLFSGDMFMSLLGRAIYPPMIFNSEPDRLPDSFRRMASLDAPGLVPNHHDGAPPAEHRKRFDQVSAKWMESR